MMSPADDERNDQATIRDLDQLVALFVAWEKPPTELLVGVETERFGIDLASGRPLPYAGEGGILSVFSALGRRGWQPYSETPNGPIIALERNGTSITLEPGAQLELSGAPFRDLHEIARETAEHLAELQEASAGRRIAWLGIGFHPTARLEDFDSVPKRRYSVMREYLPTRGSRSLDMMSRSAALQVNLDFVSEADAMRKLLIALKLAPILAGLTANSPFLEGRQSSRLSERSDVWFHMDPDRSGLIPGLWATAEPRYRDYVSWAVDAPMFLFTRGERVFRNTGQIFRDFMQHGYEGEVATVGDFKTHLNTLFPEARLKRTLELRSCDSQSSDVATAIPTLLVGLFYDTRSLALVSELVAPWTLSDVERTRREASLHGLKATVAGQPLARIVEKLVDWARDALVRRAVLDDQGRSEAVYLEPFERALATGQTPADVLLAHAPADFSDPRVLLEYLAASACAR